jgi:hypothetical protein
LLIKKIVGIQGDSWGNQTETQPSETLQNDKKVKPHEWGIMADSDDLEA